MLAALAIMPLKLVIYQKEDDCFVNSQVSCSVTISPSREVTDIGERMTFMGRVLYMSCRLVRVG